MWGPIYRAGTGDTDWPTDSTLQIGVALDVLYFWGYHNCMYFYTCSDGLSFPYLIKFSRIMGTEEIIRRT